MQAAEENGSADKTLAGVQAVLDETLGLGGQAFELTLESELLGSIPELDSQAVLHVLLGLEEKFDIEVDDDDVDADVFETVGSLVSLVHGKLSD
ncbi:MAG: acyl carrier protein [Woeseiaceae bacterium]